MNMVGGVRSNFRSHILHEYDIHTTHIEVVENILDLEELRCRLAPLASDNRYELVLVIPDTEPEVWAAAKSWRADQPNVRPARMLHLGVAGMALTALQLARGRYVQVPHGDRVVTYPKWLLLAAVSPSDGGDLSYAAQRLSPCNMEENDDPLLAYHGALCRAMSRGALNIVCAVPNIVPNGAQRMALMLAVALKGAGHHVDVVSTERRDDDDQAWSAAGLEPLPILDGSLWKVLGDPKYDVAISHVWPGVERALQAAPTCPTMVVHHSCDVVAERVLGGSSRLHAVVAHPDRANLVIPAVMGEAPPVAPFPNTALTGDREPRRQRQGEGKLILCLTRAEPEKGGDILLAAADSLSKLGRLVVVGLGEHQPLYRDLVQELSRIGAEAHGIIPHEDVMALMAEADVLLFTSRREANSVALIEAAMMGVPVACTPGSAPHWWDNEKGWPIVVADSIAPEAIVAAVASTLSTGLPGAPYLPSELSHEYVVSRYETGLRLLAKRGVWEAALALRTEGGGTYPVHVVNEGQGTASFARLLRADVAVSRPTMVAPTLRILLTGPDGMIASVWDDNEMVGQIVFDPEVWAQMPVEPTTRILCLPPIVVVDSDGVDFWRRRLYDMGCSVDQDVILRVFAPDGRVARAAAALYHQHHGGQVNDARRNTRS
jgi:glycosyltransferase involved in cell wall biosynthesis